MKTISIFLLSCLTILSATAQQYKNTVTINVNSRTNPQVTIDGKNYTINSNVSAGSNTELTLYDMAMGQHTLEVTRSFQSNNKVERIRTIFNLRNDYNMHINITGNGSFELIEKMKAGTAQGGPAISNEVFTSIMRNIRYQNTTAKRRTVIYNAFSNPDYYFTTNQVRQMLQQVNLDSYRFELAKMSYSRVTDRENFYQLYSSISNQQDRQDLERYAENYRENHNPNAVAMSDPGFNKLYQEARGQWPASNKISFLRNAFSNSSYYFTSTQVKKLVTLANSENNRLELARQSYRGVTDPENFYQIYTLFSSQDSKDDLASYVANYDEETPGQNAMTVASFDALYNNIQGQWPAATQINSISTAFNNNGNYFTSAQARQMIQLISEEEHRLHLAKLSYARITDPDRFNTLEMLFNNPANRTALANYVNSYQSGVRLNTAMGDTEFTTLYQSINRQFMPNEQMTSLTGVFNKEGNYFITTQARQLIQLVSYESNRLQLAKLSYRTITDRDRFNELYDLLDSQSSKDELDAYVKAYKD